MSKKEDISAELSRTWGDIGRSLQDKHPRSDVLDNSNFLRRAMLVTVHNLGGQDLVDKYGPSILDRSTVFPSHAMGLLEARYPEITGRIMKEFVKVRRKKVFEDFWRGLRGQKARGAHELLTDGLSRYSMANLKGLIPGRGRAKKP